MEYKVTYRDAEAGWVELVQHGLYYEIKCCCQYMDGLFRLVDICDKGSVMIGVCAPARNGLEIQRSIPVKALGTGKHAFELTCSCNNTTDFVPLNVQLPTAHLCELDKSVFGVLDGVPGLLFGG